MSTEMKTVGLLILASVLLSGCAKSRSEAGGTNLTFAGVEYIHRWSQNGQNEFTPAGQEDLDRWSDMMTICCYRNVTEGEGLAATANAVLENYKVNGAMVLKTDSVPMTKDRPAEHFVAAVFPRPDLIEAVFARFRIADGVGYCIIYSHREYGRKIGDPMSAWLKEKGPAIEKALMSWEQKLSVLATNDPAGPRVPAVTMEQDSRLPTKPEPGERAPWPQLHLTGVVGSGANGACLIDGQVISVGADVQGVRIVEIKAGVVVAEFRGERRVLKCSASR